MLTQIIDFHTHAFPDSVAKKAIPQLEAGAKTKAFHDGKVSSLLTSMDKAGISISVICSIATKPTQFPSILAWSKEIASERLYPLASIHPQDPMLEENIWLTKKTGLKGIKLHPYYQNFSLTDENILPLYRACQEAGLLIVCHTGFDIAFPHERIADPDKILFVKKSFPDLFFITTHTGGWFDWEEVEKKLIGKEIYIEISYTMDYLPEEKLVQFLENHPEDYLLFGTDSPWDDQAKALKQFLELPIKDSLKEKMLFTNPARLLKLE